MARTKQAEIRREAKDVAEAVDVMVDALAALDRKAQIANVELDTLFVEFVEGYQNPHGKQTAQQGGFAAVNRLLAEMSDAQKDKAEDIVKGMKKKASYFKKKYGKDAKSVMYATANKMAQEDVNESLKDWFGKGKKGDWIRVGTDGKIKGDCAREEGEGKPKCMPRSKAHSMSKKDRASAARRKRAADPVADRPGKGGKPIMVKTQKESKDPITKKEKYMMTGRHPFDPKKGLMIDVDKQFENFMDGKNPQDKGDAKRHGLSGKMSKSALKKVRGSDKASPRKKQLAHFLLNMTKGKKK